MAFADIGSSVVDIGEQQINYKHISPQIIFTHAGGRLLKIDLKKRGQSAGYIMGAGDEIPSALRQMGYTVELLSDKDLQEAALAQVRCYYCGCAGIQYASKASIKPKSPYGLCS